MEEHGPPQAAPLSRRTSLDPRHRRRLPGGRRTRGAADPHQILPDASPQLGNSHVRFPLAAAPLLPLAISRPWAGSWLAARLKLAIQRSAGGRRLSLPLVAAEEGGHWRQRERRQRARSGLRCLSQQSVSEIGRGYTNASSRHWLSGFLGKVILANSRRASSLPREGGSVPAPLLASAGCHRLAVGGRAEAGGEEALGRP